MSHSVEELCAPHGLLPKEQTDYWRRLAQELYALATQYASECAECGGEGVKHVQQDGDDAEFPCGDCADIRAVIAKAEGRK